MDRSADAFALRSKQNPPAAEKNSVVVQVSEEVEAVAWEAPAWGTKSPRLYLSYGMVAMKGMRPVLTDAVKAAQSFTVLSSLMGLDFFAVLDGHCLDAAAAGSESERLLTVLRDAVGQQVDVELWSDSPRFLEDRLHDDVVGWWATTLREAFRAFHEEVAACKGEHSVDAPTGTAIVVLVLEKYLVFGNCGASKAVISRDNELVELISFDSEHKANREDENKSVDNTAGGASPGSSVSPAVGVVDVVAVKREARDEFLIMASAALWDKVTPKEACAHVRRRLGRTSRVTMPWETRITDAEGSPMLLAEELAKKAVHAGSRDNVSVGLVMFRDFWAPGRAQAGNK